MNITTNALCESLCRNLWKGSTILDENKISWKLIGDKWIGKRSVWTYDYRSCWLEDTTVENVKTWWLGKDADYEEIFARSESLESLIKFK